MDIRDANEIIACLPKERTVYRYCNDEYAARLLAPKLGSTGVPVREIRATRWGRLLDRKPVATVLKHCGAATLCNHDLLGMPRENDRAYVLTLGLWGWRGGDRSYYQTSRRGVNVVLQVNFDREHDETYRRVARPVSKTDLNYSSHPVCKRGRTTMAWVRLDLDLASGQALIEEVQNDWLRGASSARAAAVRAINSGRPNDGVWGIGPARGVKPYCEYVLKRHAHDWAEVALSAAIGFLIDEIGISQIWYHDSNTGARVKRIKWSKPPRSIYTSLPRSFCFKKTSQAPDFLVSSAQKNLGRRMRRGEETFWRMDATRKLN